MSLKNDILERQKIAMKSKDTKTLSVMRMLMTEIKNTEIDARSELSDDDIARIVRRQVKQLKDARSDIVRGGRQDLVGDIDAEIDILAGYLPQEMSDADLELLVRGIIEDIGETRTADVGRVMGMAMKAVDGRAGGARVRDVVMTLLGS